MFSKFREFAQRTHAVRLTALAVGVGCLAIGLVHLCALAASGVPAALPAVILVANGVCSGITAYPADANGDVSPISGGGIRDPRSVAIDSFGNIYVANFDDDSVTVYPKGSKGHAVPSATISGSNTGLFRPIAVALDGNNNIYVANYDAAQ